MVAPWQEHAYAKFYILFRKFLRRAPEWVALLEKFFQRNEMNSIVLMRQSLPNALHLMDLIGATGYRTNGGWSCPVSFQG